MFLQMLEFAPLVGVAFVAGGLTLFTGFGLATMLLPVAAALLPAPSAVAVVAVAHLAANVFKFGLLGSSVRWSVVWAFGLPALIAAGLGAWLLTLLTGLPEWLRYTLAGYECVVTPLKLALAGLMLAFAWVELRPKGERSALRLPLPVYGALSGFFGGLSGHQGAFRSAALLTLGLDKRVFIATGVAIACGVDVVRLAVYAGRLGVAWENKPAMLAVVLGALAGVWAGKTLLPKVTLATVRKLVGGLLAALAVLLGLGVV